MILRRRKLHTSNDVWQLVVAVNATAGFLRARLNASRARSATGIRSSGPPNHSIECSTKARTRIVTLR
jgi:hypothetical protein